MRDKCRLGQAGPVRRLCPPRVGVPGQVGQAVGSRLSIVSQLAHIVA